MKYVILLNGEIKPISEPSFESTDAYCELYTYLAHFRGLFDSEQEARLHLSDLRIANKKFGVSR